VADKLGIEVIDLTNEDVMHALRGDLGIGVVTGDPGQPTGIADDDHMEGRVNH
jgi:hypothetical protein